MVHSTRSKEEITISKAILKGLAKDGGLFVFDQFPKLELEKLYDCSYQEMAYQIMKGFLDEFSEEEIRWAINEAYSKKNFKEEVVSIQKFENYAYLELFNGPTAAFKDMALTILPKLMYLSKKKNNIEEETHIYVATSGDTGSATLSGFQNIDGIDVTVLYPNKLVSELQEKQMLYYSNQKSRAYAFQGNFDDCQRMVKEIALKNSKISSANSINIGRLIPQVVYYVYGYCNLVKTKAIKKGEFINVSVPTGNFGNILACYIAKEMGLPIHKMICASNENNVLYDFIHTGVYNRNREFIKTYAPSMDILVSSNIERLLFYYFKDTEKVNQLFKEFKEKGEIKIDKEVFKDFDSYYCTNKEILASIKKEYETHHYLIDPHTAVAYDAYEKSDKDYYTLVVSTASCYKFSDAMKDAEINLDMNQAIDSILKVEKKEIDIEIRNNVVNEEEIWKKVENLK